MRVWRFTSIPLKDSELIAVRTILSLDVWALVQCQATTHMDVKPIGKLELATI